jgi:hypothetical protein
MQRILVYGVDVSDPENPKYRAMQVDQHGRLVIDPEELDTRYLRLDGLYPMTADLDMATHNIILNDLLIKRASADYLGVRDATDTSWKAVYCAGLTVLGGGLTWDAQNGILRAYASIWGNVILQAKDTAYRECAKLYGGGGGGAEFSIARAGDIIPVSTKTKSLGSAAKYWNQLFVDAILCSNSIDMHPTAGDAVIYFKHDGAANEASLRYDKVNKRLELWIDGAIVGYCNAALGWVNGAP